LGGENNTKIDYPKETDDKLKLKEQKYALFEIKTKIGKNFVLKGPLDTTEMFAGCNSIFAKTKIKYPNDDEENKKNKEIKAIEAIINHFKNETNAT
jgi:hypothetical protein